MTAFQQRMALAALVAAAAVAPAAVFAQPPGDGGGPPGDDGTDTESVMCSVEGLDAGYVEELVTGDTDFGSYRSIFASGCPNHWNYCQKMECDTFTTEAAVRNTTYEVPSYPRFRPDGTTTDLSCQPGGLGVALNGVSIFGQTDGTDACGDAIASEATTFDVCGAHAEPSGEYHYHTVPQCLLDQIGEEAGAHSPQVGWALDGFPIYGPFGEGGVMMYPCDDDNADETYCLDDCNGYRGSVSIDDYLYRYYTSGNRGDLTCSTTVENSEDGDCAFAGEEDCCTSAVASADFWPYIIGCYVGCTTTEMQDGTCDEGDAGYTFAEVSAVAGITEMHVIEGFDYDGVLDEDEVEETETVEETGEAETETDEEETEEINADADASADDADSDSGAARTLRRPLASGGVVSALAASLVALGHSLWSL